MNPSERLLVEVALPIPLFRNFVYAVDESRAAAVVPGMRLLVPLRRGREVGICVATDVDPPARGAVKSIMDVPDAEPCVSPGLLELCRWMSEYYVVPLGVCLRAALPSVLGAASEPSPGRKTRRVARLRDDIPSLLQRDKAFSRAPQQRALFELMEQLGGSAPVDKLRELLHFSSSVLTALVARGLVSIADEVVQRDPFSGIVTSPPTSSVPTGAQRAAIGQIVGAGSGSVFLLHGVTGSGKTLVYLEVLRSALAEGKTAIVLVPEIALTPQTVDRFRAVFGDQVAVLHSALSEGERYDAWLSLRRGERRIAIGARSAVFAPLENIGAIIVDEEHENSYKQNESPRYHAREVAIVRARSAGAVVVLGSATPAVESWHNAMAGKYHLLSMPDRVAGARMPEVRAIDLRLSADGQPRGPIHSTFGAVFSPELESAIAECLGRGEQAILLLNRRGHSSFLQCRRCGDVVVCPDCSISLTYHSVPERLVCHYCNHVAAVSHSCARCGEPTIRMRGVGTQQAERLLADRFPASRVARMDMDTTGEKWSHARILSRVGNREVDILLGTQMIAKGLDFPGITLVGVIDADVGINMPDFRSSERSFQLLSQVAGRAGRGTLGGTVLIQTRCPTHHAVQRALAHDFLAYVREEIEMRAEPRYPPFVRLANILFSGGADKATAHLATAASAWIRRLISARGMGVEAVGPAPCPIERIKARWRWHLLLKSTNPAEMSRVLRYFSERYRVPSDSVLRIGIDRDPVSLL